VKHRAALHLARDGIRVASGILVLCLLVAGCVLLSPGPARGDGSGGGPSEGVLLFGLGMHVEPMGTQVSPIALAAGAAQGPVDPRRPDYHDRAYFQADTRNLRALAAILERHGGRMTLQVQSPFTTEAAESGERLLADLEARGHEIALHFHEQAHLGDAPEQLPGDVWSAVMVEEIGFIRDAGVSGPIRYWSGGNLYSGLLKAAAGAGLSVNSDWKNPGAQSTPESRLGVPPWRPAGGTDGIDVALFAAHDPGGETVFLPNGAIDGDEWARKREIEAAGGEEAWLEVLKQGLLDSLAAAGPDRVSAYHLTLHPNEFRGAPGCPYEMIDRFLTEVIDPLVAAGKVRWATHSEVADAYVAWEASHPGVDPRGGEGGT